MQGLPQDAAAWRENGWSQLEEFLAARIEQADHHYREWLSSRGVKKARLPKPVEITRPGETKAEKPKKKVVTDPREIAAWFQQHGGG